MAEATPRTLEPTLRGRQRDLTRRLIIEAFAHVALRDGAYEVSMQSVAEEAGCSLRTLYRYFPSREALVSGLDAEVQALVNRSFDQLPAGAEEDLAELMEHMLVLLTERRDLIRAWAASGLAEEFTAAVHRRVHALVDAAIDRAAPDLAPDEHTRVFAALRQVVTWRSMLSLTEHLTAAEAAMTSGWMIRALLADLADGGGPRAG
jgi:AcrR family transcriptional regulator